MKGFFCTFRKASMSAATIEDFQKLDIRVGKILKAELLPHPKYTTHKLTIDFGPEIGHKVSGARVLNYSIEELVGKRIVGVVNFPPRQIGHLFSEALTLGVPDDKGECCLISPDRDTPLGGKMY
jgi:tRNA-binding protein